MFKLSKLLYAIVNEILPVPQVILKYTYQRYEQMRKNKLNTSVFDITLNNINDSFYQKQFLNFLNGRKIKINLYIGLMQNGRYRSIDQKNCEILIICNKSQSDKDIIQHELKHCIQYWYYLYKDNIQYLKENFNLQFKTYITDFCNLMTQIYKRLNRRFNVSLDTIIQKIVIDVIDHKTPIEKYKSLLNTASQFINYKKCIFVLQIYAGLKTINDNQLNKLLPNGISKDQLKDKQKYQQFFNTLRKHIKTNVKKQKDYNIDKIIQDENSDQIDLIIQKRLLKHQDIDKTINFCCQNRLNDALTNLSIIYKLSNEQFNKIVSFLREQFDTNNLNKILSQSNSLNEQQKSYITHGR